MADLRAGIPARDDEGILPAPPSPPPPVPAAPPVSVAPPISRAARRLGRVGPPGTRRAAAVAGRPASSRCPRRRVDHRPGAARPARLDHGCRPGRGPIAESRTPGRHGRRRSPVRLGRRRSPVRLARGRGHSPDLDPGGTRKGGCSHAECALDHPPCRYRHGPPAPDLAGQAPGDLAGNSFSLLSQHVDPGYASGGCLSSRGYAAA